MPTPHEARDVAQSFGADPDRYDRARPSYPAETVSRIVAASPGPDFVDVGCGTGISSRLFRAAGCRVLGVEVDARMAEVARRDGFDVEVARFEDWDGRDRLFDAVVAGTAWHWVDPVRGAAQAGSVLRPGGRLACFWNVGQAPVELGRAFDVVYRRVMPDMPRLDPNQSVMDAYAVMLDRAGDGMREVGVFGEPEQWRYAWERVYSRDEWVDQIATHGGVSLLPADKVAALEAGIGDAVDAFGGRFTMSYTTAVVTAART